METWWATPKPEGRRESREVLMNASAKLLKSFGAYGAMVITAVMETAGDD